MSFKYTAKITRPSVNDMFFFELQSVDNLVPFKESESVFKNTVTGFLMLEVGEESKITWDELIKRKDELRADYRSTLEEIEGYLESHSEIWGTGPYYNPLSTVFEITAYFDSLDNLKNGYNILVNADTIENLDRTKNTYEELFTDDAGNYFVLEESIFNK